jgi:hypothetical protein
MFRMGSPTGTMNVDRRHGHKVMLKQWNLMAIIIIHGLKKREFIITRQINKKNRGMNWIKNLKIHNLIEIIHDYLVLLSRRLPRRRI